MAVPRSRNQLPVNMFGGRLNWRFEDEIPFRSCTRVIAKYHSHCHSRPSHFSSVNPEVAGHKHPNRGNSAITVRHWLHQQQHKWKLPWTDGPTHSSFHFYMAPLPLSLMNDVVGRWWSRSSMAIPTATNDKDNSRVYKLRLISVLPRCGHQTSWLDCTP